MLLEPRSSCVLVSWLRQLFLLRTANLKATQPTPDSVVGLSRGGLTLTGDRITPAPPSFLCRPHLAWTQLTTNLARYNMALSIQRRLFCLLLTVVSGACVVDAAYKPGWSPPSCLSSKYKPTNVSVEVDPYYKFKSSKGETVSVQRFFVMSPNGTMEPFFMRGVGYSPIPPSKYTLSRSFDMFTTEHEELWSRDLPRIKAMGSNTIRVWSWDSYRDHTGFMDAVHANGLYLVVPFMFGHQDYPDIAAPSTRYEILTNWKAFVQSVMNHPAVFGYLVGNELNEYYGSQREELFSLINTMRQIRDEVDNARHPMTVPLADSAAFVASYVNDYYRWTSFEFWSLQTYRNSTYVQTPIFQYLGSYFANSTASGLPLKPLVLTEFGADALPFEPNYDTLPADGVSFPTPTPDLTKQATSLCEMFSAARDADEVKFLGPSLKTPTLIVNWTITIAAAVSGALVMEWNDEWWKSTYADVRAPRCPNERTEVHTWCGHNVNPTGGKFILHEEWLGLNSQQYDAGQLEFCVCPRPSYYAMQQAFKCNGDPRCDGSKNKNPKDVSSFGCAHPANWGHFDANWSECSNEQWCVDRQNPFIYGQYVMIIPVTLVTAIVLMFGVHFHRQAKAEEATASKPGGAPPSSLSRSTSSGSMVGGNDDGNDAYIAEPNDLNHPTSLELHDKLTTAFNRFAYVEGDVAQCATFRSAQERLFTLIWDKYVTAFSVSGSAILDHAIRVIYEQYMEGYLLYRHPQAVHTPDSDKMLQRLALYNIIQAWAGTINHCPEKICEVYEFAEDYFDNLVDDKRSKEKQSHAARAEQVRDFHHGIVEIMRTYYLKVDQAEFTFEDVNTDSVLFREARLKADPEIIPSFWIEKKHQKNEGQANERGTEEETAGVQSPTADASAAAPQRTGCAEWNLLPEPISSDKFKLHPYLEYNKRRNPEETLQSDTAKMFFDLRKKITGRKWMDHKFAFPQKGGPFTLLFNYSWCIRYVLWQNIIASYMQPTSVTTPWCICQLYQYLGMADSAWMFLTALLHFRVLARLPPRVVAEIIFYALGTVACASTFFIEKLNPLTTSTGEYFQLTVSSGYLAATALITIVEEIYLLVKPSPPYPIPARFTSKMATTMIRAGFVGTLMVLSATFLSLKYVPVFQHLSIVDHLNQRFQFAYVPNVILYAWIALFAITAIAASWGVARFMAYRNVEPAKKTQSKRMLTDEANYLASNLVFWGLFLAINYAGAFFILVPSVHNISFDTCICDPYIPRISESQRKLCEPQYWLTCYIAVLFTWLSTELVSFVTLYGVFELLLLAFGIFQGTVLRVGNVQSWRDVEDNFVVIKEKYMARLSRCLETTDKQDAVWNYFMKALYDDCLISLSELDQYSVVGSVRTNRDGKTENVPWPTGLDDRVFGEMKGVKFSPHDKPNFRKPPRSEEALRRITQFLWSLESAWAHTPVNHRVHNTPKRAFHRVRTMPTWTCVIPIYNEPIILEEAQLTLSLAKGKSHGRISEIEYLALTYADEWDNFAERMKMLDNSWVSSPDTFPVDLVNSFLRNAGSKTISEDVRFEIRWWCSMRGQTLSRTVAGLVNWHHALVDLLRLEEGTISRPEATRIVLRKLQILVSHQTYELTKGARKMDSQSVHEQLQQIFRRLKYFEVAINIDSTFQSVRQRLRRDYLLDASAADYEARQADIKFTGNVDVTIDVDGKGATKVVSRKGFNYYPAEAFETMVVQRVGRLRIGEGKAENQMHALQFVNGMVLQAMDMNQYATRENGYKVPFALADYFTTPTPGGELGSESMIPEFRILGFPEWCYTRPLSLIGEFMGAAEWCFVTITQRVLNWPLRIRCHYGHPDFFDCFWVRNRGGQSKASPMVNTNEDIFAGYEMLGRGDRGAYVEFIETQKGRETAFGGAFTFEAKLAQGGAQQVRSYDVYRLNRGLDVFNRWSLCFTSLAFYITNLLMAISVNYYVLSIALYAVSGVTYHKLGLLDAVIAVPWLIQIGYVLALPLVVEMTLHRGLWHALAQFFKNLIPSIIFFVFHLRTKMYYFTQGLLIGKGGYAGTGRGFGLDRTSFVEIFKCYSESHFHEALSIFAVLIIYAVYGSDPIGAFFLRTFTIWFIVLSWMWAPIIFNPAPTTQDLTSDTGDMVTWILGHRRATVPLEALKRKLLAIIKNRQLIMHKERAAECEKAMNDDSLNKAKTQMAQKAAEKAAAVAAAAAAQDAPSPAAAPPPAVGGGMRRIQESIAPDATTPLVTVTSAVDTTASVNTGDTRASLVDLSDRLRQAASDHTDFKQNLMSVYMVLSDPAQTERLKRDKAHHLSEYLRLIGRNPSEKIDVGSGEGYDSIVKEYWGTADEDCWVSWWLKGVIMMQWEAEDQFFPGLINLVVQKIYLHFELFFPWIVLALTQHNILSMYFFYVIVFFVGTAQLVNYLFRKHHEYATLAKAAFLLVIPIAALFYHNNLITTMQLVWSLALYMLCISLALRGFFGAVNVASKFNHFGINGNPFLVNFTAQSPKTENIEELVRLSVENVVAENETTSKVEENRFRLFATRTKYLKYVALFRTLVPVLVTGFLLVGNALTVLMSEWLTTLNFNGRVNEAWKKSYLRSSGPEAAGPAAPSPAVGPAPAAGGATTVLSSAAAPSGTSAAQPATKDAQPAAAAAAAREGFMGSSLASHLPSRSKASKPRIHHSLIAQHGMVPPPSTSARTFTSFGSERPDDDGLDHALLGGGSSSSHLGTRSAGSAGGAHSSIMLPPAPGGSTTRQSTGPAGAPAGLGLVASARARRDAEMAKKQEGGSAEAAA